MRLYPKVDADGRARFQGPQRADRWSDGKQRSAELNDCALDKNHDGSPWQGECTRYETESRGLARRRSSAATHFPAAAPLIVASNSKKPRFRELEMLQSTGTLW